MEDCTRFQFCGKIFAQLGSPSEAISRDIGGFWSDDRGDKVVIKVEKEFT